MCRGYIRQTPVEKVTEVTASVHAHITDLSARVTVRQTFKNESNKLQEISYTYPLSKTATVSSFYADVDGRIVRSVLKEKSKAKASYDDALASGHGAYLSEQVDDGSFKCSVGSLEAGKQVTLVLTYVTELSYVEDKIFFESPANRSVNGPSQDEPSDDLFSIGSRGINKTAIPFSASVSTTSPLVKIEGNCDLESDGKNVTAFIPDNTVLSMRVIVKDSFSPVGLTEKDGKGATVASFTFHPDMTEAEDNEEINTEVIFLIDCSGSMSGSSIRAVNQTVDMSLRALPQSCHFNMIDFGSSHRSMWEKSVKYNQKSLDEAVTANSHRDADLGGTSSYNPLRMILNAPTFEGLSRQVFLLTDGEVDDPTSCIQMAKMDSHNTRIFTFGIGSGVDHKLVKGIAEAANGQCEFISEGNMHAAVMRQMNRAMKPSSTHLKMDWGHSKKTFPASRQTPYHVPPLFSGNQLTVYIRLDDSEMSKLTDQKVTATSTAKVGKKDWSQKVTVMLDQAPARVDEDLILTRLYGRSIIDSLQAGRSYLHKESGSLVEGKSADDIKREILAISSATGVLSQQTAFVAIDEYNNKEATVETPQQVDLSSISNEGSSLHYANNLPAPPPGGLYQLNAPMAYNSIPSGGSLMSLGLPPPLPPSSCMAPPPAPISLSRVSRSPAPAKLDCYSCLPSMSDSSILMDFDEEENVPQAPMQKMKKSFSPSYSTKERKISSMPSGSGGGSQNILSKQTATGSFDRTVASLLGFTWEDLKKAAKDKSDAALEVSLVAVVVEYLEKKMGGEKDSWQSSVRKAKNWMKKEAADKKLSADGWTAQAEAFVKAL